MSVLLVVVVVLIIILTAPISVPLILIGLVLWGAFWVFAAVTGTSIATFEFLGGKSLRGRVKRLGMLRGLTYDEVVAELGEPGRTVHAGVRSWFEAETLGEYGIALAFDDRLCLGVLSEQSNGTTVQDNEVAFANNHAAIVADAHRIHSERVAAQQAASKASDVRDAARIKRMRSQAERMAALTLWTQRHAKALTAIAIILVVLLGLALVAPTVIAPMLKYRQGASKVEAGEYDEALAIYSELGAYRDSTARAATAQRMKSYDMGIEAMSKRQYADALEYFEEAGGYSDSKERISEVNYQLGMESFNAEHFAVAVKHLRQVNGARRADAAAALAKAEKGMMYELYTAKVEGGRLNAAYEIAQKLPEHEGVRQTLGLVERYRRYCGTWAGKTEVQILVPVKDGKATVELSHPLMGTHSSESVESFQFTFRTSLGLTNTVKVRLADDVTLLISTPTGVSERLVLRRVSEE